MPKAPATRVAGAGVTNAIAAMLRALCVGSADLHPSTHTGPKGLGDFNPPLPPNDDSDIDTDTDTEGSDAGGWRLAGRNRLFGVRAHAMGAVVNGLAAHGFIGHGAAFPIVSDCRRPPIRPAALMGLPVGHVFTHRSPACARFRGWP